MMVPTKSMDKMELYMNAVKQAAETWKLVQALPDYHHVVGELLFRQIFDIAPMAVSLYKFGQGEPTEAAATATDGSAIPDSLFASAAFKLHAHGVVTMLEAAIGLMLGDDMETLATALQDLGSRHVSYGVHAAHYGIVETALIRTLGGALSPSGHWTDDVRKGWAALFKFVAKAMMSGAGSELQIIKSKRRDSERTKAVKSAKIRLTVIRRSEENETSSRNTVTKAPVKIIATTTTSVSQSQPIQTIVSENHDNHFPNGMNNARWEIGGGCNTSKSHSDCEHAGGGDGGGGSRFLDAKTMNSALFSSCDPSRKPVRGPKRRNSLSSSSCGPPLKPMRRVEDVNDTATTSSHNIPSIIPTINKRLQHVRAKSDLYRFKHDNDKGSIDDISLFQDIEFGKRPTDDTSNGNHPLLSPSKRRMSTGIKAEEDTSNGSHLKFPFNKRRTSMGIKAEEDTTSGYHLNVEGSSNGNHPNNSLAQQRPWPSQQRCHSFDAPPKVPQRSQTTTVTTSLRSYPPQKQGGRDLIVSVPILLEHYACDGIEADKVPISPVTAGRCSCNSSTSLDDHEEIEFPTRTPYWYWCEMTKNAELPP